MEQFGRLANGEKNEPVEKKRSGLRIFGAVLAGMAFGNADRISNTVLNIAQPVATESVTETSQPTMAEQRGALQAVIEFGESNSNFDSELLKIMRETLELAERLEENEKEHQEIIGEASKLQTKAQLMVEFGETWTSTSITSDELHSMVEKVTQDK